MASWLSPRRLAGLVAPMTVWALHFVGVYGLQGLACAGHGSRHDQWGEATVTWVLVLLTVAALAAIAWLGLRAWRVRVRCLAADGAARHERDRFLSAATTLLAVLAAIAIVFTATPILLLAPCA